MPILSEFHVRLERGPPCAARVARTCQASSLRARLAHTAAAPGIAPLLCGVCTAFDDDAGNERRALRNHPHRHAGYLKREGAAPLRRARRDCSLPRGASNRQASLLSRMHEGCAVWRRRSERRQRVEHPVEENCRLIWGSSLARQRALTFCCSNILTYARTSQ